jgi:hypothetical protein
MLFFFIKLVKLEKCLADAIFYRTIELKYEEIRVFFGINGV